MRNTRIAAALTAAMLMSAAAAAKDGTAAPSPWTGCGANRVSGLSKIMVGPTAARAMTPTATPDEGIARCTAEIDALQPDAGWERRAALLRSRANFYIAAKQHRDALADLDAIVAIERPDAVYARSFGVSVNMLRALALMQAGRRDDAAAAAFKARDARPWSLRVADFAFGVAASRTTIPAGERGGWDKLVLLDPAMYDDRATVRARAGEWNDALADWQVAKPAPGDIGRTYITRPNITVRGLPGIPITGVNIADTAEAIIAAHVAGQPELAETWLARARENIAAPREPTGIEKTLKLDVKPDQQRNELDKWNNLFEVAALVGKGNAAAAADRLAATLSGMPVGATTLALATTVLTKLPPESHPELRAAVAQVEAEYRFEINARYVAMVDAEKLLTELPDHEDVMLANPYRSTVKFLKANGFSTKIAADGKTAEVSFFGNKSQLFAIGEMALLRAADLTVERGMSAFRILDNDDYVQTSQMTMNGTPVGPSTVSGHFTKLKIEFVDPANAADSAGLILASDVQAALRPIYVKPDVKP